jgi:hypothetical protein
MDDPDILDWGAGQDVRLGRTAPWTDGVNGRGLGLRVHEDGSTYDRVICRDVFITSFRKAFSILGVEPDDFVALEFDHQAKTVLARAGGLDLFESMQETSPSDLTDEECDGDTEDYLQGHSEGEMPVSRAAQ